MPCIFAMRNAFSDVPPNNSKPQETKSCCSMQESSLSVNCQNKEEHEKERSQDRPLNDLDVSPPSIGHIQRGF